jgi:mycofactocin system glycosyltransferase
MGRDRSTAEGDRRGGAHAHAHATAHAPAPAADGDRLLAGRYRRREGVAVEAGVLYSLRPLSATRLNDAGVAVVDALAEDAFRSPAAVAAGADRDPAAVARLLDRLHRRGFLEWAPARDPDHRPPVSVVVVVRDDRDRLLDCLDALAALAYPAYEVVVVDDGSTDGTPAAARAHALAADDRLRVVEVGSPSAPLGIGASRNRGVAAAAHDVVAFTDADCRPRPDWLAALVPSLAAHDVVGGRVRPAGDAPADAYEAVHSSLDMGARAARVDPDGATPYLPTANLLGRRSVLEAVPFPPRSVAEDVDVCRRAVEAGYDVVYAAAGVVEHDYRSSLRSFAARRADYGASEALLAAEYGHGEATPLPLEPIVAGVVALAAGLVGGVAAGLAVAALAALLLAGREAVGVARHRRRLDGLVDPSTLVRSRLRSALSAAYALAREATRYYALPLGLLGVAAAVVGWGAGRASPGAGAGAATGTGTGTGAGAAVPGAPAALGAVGAARLVALAVAVVLPAVVDYAVHRPATSPPRYAAFYLADHLGYGAGVHRGAVAHRTVAHLSPAARLRPAGPLAAVARSLRPGSGSGSGDDAGDADAAGETVRVSVAGTSARFRVASSAERWWFGDEGTGTGLRDERPVLADLLGRLRGDDVLLDVGANVGLYSCLAGRALGDGRVLAVEPHPANADRLRENLARNGVAARVVPRALGASEGPGRLLTDGDEPGTGSHALAVGDRSDGDDASPSSSRGGAAAAADGIAVPVVAGDALLDREGVRPTVLKVDVEGAERAVLDGLRETLADPACRLVYCEVHPEASAAPAGVAPDAVERRLRERGFAVDTLQRVGDRRLLRAVRDDADGDGRGRD